MTPPKRILIADDHTEIVQEIRSLLQQDYEIIGAVGDGAALVKEASRLKPDLIISDVSMPVMNGFEAAGKIRSLGLKTHIIFLTVHSSPPYLRKARSLGASGYVLKVYANEQLPIAVSTVLRGESYTSPELGASDLH